MPELTRVVVVNDGKATEYWADSWTLATQDDGRTLKLFGRGDGTVARENRDVALMKDLDATFEQIITTAMGESDKDFQTVPWLSKTTGLSEDIVRSALKESSLVRRPVIDAAKYDDWWRLKSRGLTRKERWARWQSLLFGRTLRSA
ncbi:MAG: hypothetical protein E6R04_08575 [Spirochaetes bacterium]|nr:MAG: hypothetical protein E6R04_08575 [Spirochaetota bacterium]